MIRGMRSACRYTLWLSFWLLATIALGACSPRAEPVYVRSNLEVRHYRLPNGLEVVLHPDATLPDVTVDVRYAAGSRDDPPNLHGLAHLVEHLAFRRVLAGAPPRAPEVAPSPPDADAPASRTPSAPAHETIGEVETRISRHFNAFTSRDETEFTMVVDRGDLPLALWIEAQRMASPLEGVTEEVLVAERSVVQNEIRERYETAPYGRVSQALVNAVFSEVHPYHVPWTPPERLLSLATLASAARFTRTHYQPSNATLVISGRFDVAQAARLTAAAFGRIPSSPPRPPAFHVLPRLTKPIALAYEAGVTDPLFAKAWLVPPRGHAGNLEAELMGEMLTWFVRGELREDEWSICRARVINGSLGSLLVLTLELPKGMSLTAARDRVDASVKRLADVEEPLESWGALKSSAIAAHTFDMQRSDTRAQRFQADLAVFGAPDVFQPMAEAYSRIRFQDVIASARVLLRDAHGVELFVHPQLGAPRGGRPL